MAEPRQTILIIDDTASEIKILADLLHAEYTTLFAKDGPTGLQLARSRHPDVILLDILMPDMDGYEVYRRLKADPATAGIPIIFVTALGGETHEIEGLELGAVDYISKPFQPSVVRARIRNHLAMHQGIRLREDIDRMIQHDMRSPLSALLSLTDYFIADGETPPKMVPSLQSMRSCLYRLLNMLKASLDMYAMENGAFRFTPQPVDLLQVVGNIIQDIRLQHHGRAAFAVTVRGRPAEQGKPFCVLADELPCYSLFSNLLQNAVEASPARGTVSVALDDAPDGMRAIRIHNRGAVPESIRDRFFEKYATAGKARGTGLGTYIAKLIAETLGGRISMSTSPEEGTTVTVLLPAAPVA
jgi:signal transduction histidine kinase